jgi:hypothetical protein
VHSSDDVPAAARDFGIWFTADDLPLLASYQPALTTPTDTKEHS